MAPAFDAFLMADWSARSQPAPARPSPDAIWLAWRARRQPTQLTYCRTRPEAESYIVQCLNQPIRILAGFDFGFVFPAWFHRALALDWLAFWEYLDRVIVDTPTNNNRFEIAADLNLRLSGGPFPFWATPHPTPLLPACRPSGYDERRPEFRTAESYLRRLDAHPQPSFKLYTAGCVGSQILLGLPLLARLRRRFPGEVSVWPFEPPNRRIVFAETYPSLFPFDRFAPSGLPIKDARQVAAVVEILRRAQAMGLLRHFFDLPPEAALYREEGWVLGGNAELPELLARLIAE
jgi:molybdopterin molybdotransferase